MAIGKKLLLAAGLSLLAIIVAFIIALVVLMGANNVSPDHDQKIAAGYFNGLSVDGYTFRVLNNTSEIPYAKGDAKDPSKYWSVIPPFKDTWPLPVNNSGLESVKLYTWSETDGLLILWDLVISGDNVTMVNANLIDAGLGSYNNSNNGFFDACKNIMVSGPTAKDVFDQYRRIYENHNEMLKNTAINYIDNRFLDFHEHILLVLNSSNDIPYKDGDLKAPDDYSTIIHPPVVSTWPFRQPNDTDYGKIDSVSLYTWSRYDGLLIKWDVQVVDDRVIQLNANLADLEVGDYLPFTKDLFIYGKGVNLSGIYLRDIDERYAQQYRNKTNTDYYPEWPSFTPEPIPPQETRPLTIHLWNNYRYDFKAGEKCYVSGYVTEKTYAGYDLPVIDSRVDITVKKGENIVFEDSYNGPASFLFSYEIPGNEQPTNYTVALTASKAPEDNFKYTNGTAATTFRVLAPPAIDSIELERSNQQYQGEAIFHAGQACFVILWLGPDCINEPFLPGRYSATINATPAIDQNRISYCGWIIQNTGSVVRNGIVYIVFLPDDARPGQYRLDAKVSYYLGECSATVSSEKSDQVTITDRIDSNFITARPSS